MWNHLKKYPFSFLTVSAVIYLSFFKPTASSLPEIPNLDKLVHFCMYWGVSGVYWIEILRASRKKRISLPQTWLKAFLGPVLMSGCIELLQEFLTSYRGGDWNDFLANITGALVASTLISGIYYHRLRKYPD